jgi:hypothetical protein
LSIFEWTEPLPCRNGTTPFNLAMPSGRCEENLEGCGAPF